MKELFYIRIADGDELPVADVGAKHIEIAVQETAFTFVELGRAFCPSLLSGRPQPKDRRRHEILEDYIFVVRLFVCFLYWSKNYFQRQITLDK